jgi:DnaJ-domain-containing protein 1
MTDYFALLDQPRRPWLDPEALKQAYHEKTLRQHPDAQASASAAADVEAKFARLNEAHQTLQDPKLRLQHLLALEGQAVTSRFDAVPADLADLFPAIASVTQDATRVSEKAASATSALSRSLLAPELVQVRNRIATLLETLSHLQAAADAELQRISVMFRECDDATAVTLHRLRVRYSYLRRWIAQLEEHRTALATV